jgi:hypothetical protein
LNTSSDRGRNTNLPSSDKSDKSEKSDNIDESRTLIRESSQKDNK